AVTEKATDPQVSSSFPSYHAFIRARVRTLPPTLSWRNKPSGSASEEGRGGGREPGVHPGSPGLPSASPGSSASRRQGWRKDRRAMLAAEFLASDEAEDLSDREAASRCADHIVNYGCDQDFGRPLRM